MLSKPQIPPLNNAPGKLPARPRFQENKLTDYPKLRDLYAIPSVAMTVLIMAYSGLYGVYPILLLYAMWLSRVIFKGHFILKPSKDIYPAIGFASYCILTTLWSDYPGITIHAAVEFFTMILCAIVMVRIVRTESLIKGMIVGTTLVLITTIISGRYGKDAFSESYALIGMFGSKNQVGLYAEVGMFASLVFLFTKSGKLQKFLYSICPLLFACLCLYLSRSGTAIATLVATLFAVYGIYRVVRFSPRNRKTALSFVIFVVSITLLAGIYMGGAAFSLKLMGKDATLTGRTYLWAEGIKNGLLNPVGGVGYSAFWVVGRQAAETYWFKFGINARNGFHFHNLYIQTFADLGFVGLFWMIYMIISNCTKSLRYALLHGSSAKAFFCLGMAFMFLFRAFAEVDFLGPFGIGCLMFFSVNPLLATKEQTEMKLTASPL